MKGGAAMNKSKSLLWSTIVTVTMVVSFFSMTPVVQAAELSVETSAVCENVVDRQPLNEGTSFSVSVGRLYYFTKIVGAEAATEVTHVWWFGPVERARIRLPVGGSSWRTFSSKALQPHEVGTWRVEVIDADGNNLETVEFTVTN
jgi:hypothetical protein